MDNNRYCVIMCGGVGSRFWPYSRARKPKQFIDFFGTGRSLLQMTVDRIQGIVPQENIVIITNSQYSDIITEQLPHIKPEQILLEPARRNTAPCIAWAAYHIKAINPDAQIMVTPSDHLILKVEDFRLAADKAFDFITAREAIVTLGIKPNRPETGYGYIQVGEQVGNDFSVVKTFTEKPNADLARVFVDSGEFFWNSGMFFWRASTIVDAIHNHASDIASVLDMGLDTYGTQQEQAFINGHFASCRNVSIDFAVMEHAPNVYVECVDLGWSDLGTWGSLYENSPKSANGNVTQMCRSLLTDCHDNIIAVKDGKLIVASGLNDYIVADTDDVLLIVPKAQEQRIRDYVNEVKEKFDGQYL